MKIKTFVFPTFEEWEKRKNEVRLELGAYCCEVSAFSWSNDGVTYMLAASLADRNPLNIYTSKIFRRCFEYKGDHEKLKDWYESSVLEFNAFWENHIMETYFETE